MTATNSNSTSTKPGARVSWWIDMSNSFYSVNENKQNIWILPTTGSKTEFSRKDWETYGGGAGVTQCAQLSGIMDHSFGVLLVLDTSGLIL